MAATSRQVTEGPGSTGGGGVAGGVIVPHPAPPVHRHGLGLVSLEESEAAAGAEMPPVGGVPTPHPPAVAAATSARRSPPSIVAPSPSATCRRERCSGRRGGGRAQKGRRVTSIAQPGRWWPPWPNSGLGAPWTVDGHIGPSVRCWWRCSTPWRGGPRGVGPKGTAPRGGEDTGGAGPPSPLVGDGTSRKPSHTTTVAVQGRGAAAGARGMGRRGGGGGVAPASSASALLPAALATWSPCHE